MDRSDVKSSFDDVSTYAASREDQCVARIINKLLMDLSFRIADDICIYFGNISIWSSEVASKIAVLDVDRPKTIQKLKETIFG